MADTALVRIANRMGAMVYFSGTSSTVAIDAQVAETFFFPQEVGDVMVYAARAFTGAFSGAYVAPQLAPPAISLDVVSQDLATYIDTIGAEPAQGRRTAQVAVIAQFNPFFGVLVRRNERLIVVAPVMAGAGVTANWVLEVRALRLPIGAA